jgi:phosphopantothenoylcysteine decarboxylase/phosphopantothenate--cysteine ligase
MFSGRRIVLGVTGGIAAYKSVTLLRELQKAGADVRVMMTPAATRFVGVETFRALSRHPVPVHIFEDGTGVDSSPLHGGIVKDNHRFGETSDTEGTGSSSADDAGRIEGVGKSEKDTTGSHWTKHIEWGEWADLMLIAPCTANTLSDIVHGRSNNMVLVTLLAARCPVMICPTMDGEMIRHPAVQQNLKHAREMGYTVLDPDVGYLASGLHDQGRLPETERILEVAYETLKRSRLGGPLAGRRVLVTAGPTREFLDPVRFLSNPSSGKMGLAMADAAAALGGDVILLRGPGVGDASERMTEVLEFSDAESLMALVKRFADTDVVVMAAAVSDFRPAETSTQKIKKDSNDPEEVLHLKLVRNPDILRWLGEQKRDAEKTTKQLHPQVLIGFAMESENLIPYAEKKLAEKNVDWICANLIASGKSGFETDQNHITLIGNEAKKEFQGEKRVIAKQILREIFS